MPTLKVMAEGKVLLEWPLGDQETLIGRGVDCHIVLRDPLVSRHHAKIARIYTGYFVEDLQSTNGITLNGRRVTKHMLKNTDRVQVGTHELCFVASEEETEDGVIAEDDRADKTIAFAPQGPLRESLIPSLAERAGRAYVRFLTGPDAGNSQPLEKLYSIGEPGGDLAAIARRGLGYVIQHLGGARITTLNGDPVPAGAGVRLKSGDKIQVGDIRLEFYIEP